jgi:hypothetical protein
MIPVTGGGRGIPRFWSETQAREPESTSVVGIYFDKESTRS